MGGGGSKEAEYAARRQGTLQLLLLLLLLLPLFATIAVCGGAGTGPRNTPVTAEAGGGCLQIQPLLLLLLLLLRVLLPWTVAAVL
jgi:hypothetical protein